jgi:hypothetical protein
MDLLATRIYETSRAHNSDTFLSSGTQRGFVVQEPLCHGFVDTKRSVYGFSRTDINGALEQAHEASWSEVSDGRLL